MKRFFIIPIVFSITISMIGAAGIRPVSGDENSAVSKSSDTAVKTADTSVMPTDKADIPEIVAVVNGQKIFRNDFEREVMAYQQRLRSQGQQTTQQNESGLREEVLKDLISRELVYQESQKKGIKVPKEEVDKVINDIKARYPDTDSFNNILKRVKMSEEGLRTQIIHQSAIRKLVDQEIMPKINITEDATKTFYDQNPQYFRQPEMVHARHILIKVASGASESDKAEARKKIEAIKKRADAGEDFGELAKAESQGPSAPKGGDLGFFPRGRMVPSFEKAAFDLKVNEISDVVETNFGYHIIQVLDRKEARTMSYDEVKDRIAANLKNQQVQEKMESYITELRKTATIETTMPKTASGETIMPKSGLQ